MAVDFKNRKWNLIQKILILSEFILIIQVLFFNTKYISKTIMIKKIDVDSYINKYLNGNSGIKNYIKNNLLNVNNFFYKFMICMLIRFFNLIYF